MRPFGLVVALVAASLSCSVYAARPVPFDDVECAVEARTLAAQAAAGNVDPFWRAAYGSTFPEAAAQSVPLAYRVQMFQWNYGPRYMPLEKWFRWAVGWRDDRHTRLAYAFCMRNRTTSRRTVQLNLS
jgi:hypothetical protein